DFSPAEIEGRITAYRTLEHRVKAGRKQLDPEQYDAFFQLVEYPVTGAANMNYKWLYAQKARHAATLDEARRYEEMSVNAYDAITALDRYYNFELKQGKWNGIINMNNNRFVFEKFELPDDFSPASQPKKDSGEKRNFISRNAVDADNPLPEGAYPIEELGYSRQAVVLPAGETLTYTFETAKKGDAAIWVSLLPTYPVNGGDLRYEISVDDDTPQTVSFKTVGRSEPWKINVLRNLALTSTRHTLTKNKKHIIYIKALDEGVVVDQLMLDFEPEKPFYRIPEPVK
ncbi:MAG: hypothetical protein LUI04_02185, partial [Porphyromonadaceae bacterium]|nr:hypothetical protein [Porphyromonadaceae bacterium]